MTFIITTVVHWLHVVAGAVWVGGQVFGSLVMWPALLGRPAAEARAIYDASAASAGRVMGGSGMVLLVLGPVRGTLLGPIRSWHVLFATPYGLTFIASALLTLGLMVHGGRTHGRMETRVWRNGEFAPGAGAFLRRSAAVTMAGLAAILACMVLMRFGL